MSALHAFTHCRAFLRDERAASAAEFALVLPVFLGLTFSAINGSIMLSAAIQTHYAAERAARCLSVDVAGNCTSGTIDAFAKTFYNGPALTGMVFTASQPACGNQVVGTGTYQLISGLDVTTVTIGATACYPLS
ncbi:MAG: TadE/TadG family type IV pilus assembly protein [Novosphingobium sp.]